MPTPENPIPTPVSGWVGGFGQQSRREQNHGPQMSEPDRPEIGCSMGDNFEPGGLTHPPRYNAAPTQPVLAVMNGEERRAEHRWGLIPSWARSASVGSRLINARAETATELPSFRTAFTRRRCLVLADGFYEWRRVGNSRILMRIVMKSGEPFAFAGLWDTWRDPEGEMVRSCTIITTEPNKLLRPIHDRMPAILSRDAEPLWLDDDLQDPGLLGNLLSPYPADLMEACRVSALANRPSNDGPEVDPPGRGRVPTVPERTGQPEAVLGNI